MKLNDYDDYNSVNKGFNISVAGVICILAMLTVIGIVLAMNKSKTKTKTSVSSSAISAETEEISVSASSYASILGNETHVSDLDFYDMYPKDTTVASALTSEELIEEEQEAEVDETTDGKHTKIVWQDGSEEWVAINPYLQTHDYDFTNLINRSGEMEYYENGKVTSTLGIDISKDNDYIDFYKLAKTGVSFVMIRLGARGYQTGQLIMDDYFLDNIKRANDAGLKIGIYFMSQAITELEAEEEADLVIENLRDYELTYPVCYVMQYTENETSRVEILDKTEKTAIAMRFMDRIKAAGYKPMIYGTKLWLIKYLDLTKIVSHYDIWLSQFENLPDFPYKFAMWQYTNNGTADGVKGAVNYNVCFTDFSIK